MKINLQICSTVAVLVLLSSTSIADMNHERNEDRDFGTLRDKILIEHSSQFFGIEGALEESSTDSISITQAESNPLAFVTFAKSLRARVVSSASDLGANIDMMTLWPNDNAPTHIIACNEQGTANAGLQRIRLNDGLVETILSGTVSCDPVHRTAWGTIVFGEEAGNSGTLLELIDPLNTTDVVYDRNTGTFSGNDAAHVTERPALGHLSFEGVAVLSNGVTYYSDENRPSKGAVGGAYFKFVPSIPWTGDTAISDLANSPLASGEVFGLRLGKRSGNTDYGQGSNTGFGTWISINNAYDADLRSATVSNKLTGYYRPEDMAIDLKSLASGNIRICANNTGNEESNNNWGETICLTDGTIAEATLKTSTPEVQIFATGTPEFAMMDNIAYQPRRGNWLIHEDGDAPSFTQNPHNNDLWMCLEDGRDVDTLSDGCIRIATLNDFNAEWTGGVYDASGKHLYVSVQHNVTGHGVILDVTGWR